MCLDAHIEPRAIVSLNGALLPLDSLQGLLFSPLARLLAGSPFTARFFAWGARDRGAVERLIASTGSTLDDAGVELYWRLVRSSAHVDGALQMMAHWDLQSLSRDLPSLVTPLTLVVGDADRTVPPGDAGRVVQLLPRARVLHLPGLGHLAHEERADAVADIIFGVADAVGTADAHD
jgi:magnesium chelatase accessory protein